MGASAFDEQKGAATSAGDEAFTRPSGFASFADKLRGDLDKIAVDATGKDVLDALAELSEAVGKMATTVAGAGEHVLYHLNSVATGDLTLEIDQTIKLIAVAAAAGEAGWVMDTTRLLMEAAEDITRHLTEAIEEEKAAAGVSRSSSEAVSGAGGFELEEQAVDGDASLYVQVQQKMYEEEEEAFLDELDYREMVLSVDEALDDLRLEAAGCSGGRPPTTGFLGRYDFFTLQDFLKLVD